MAGGDLKAFIDRLRRREDQRFALGRSIHDLFAAAKAIGLDTTVIRRAVQPRRQQPAQQASHGTVLDSLDEAVGIKMHESWF